MTIYKIILYEYGHAAHDLVRFQSSFSYTVQQANNTALSVIIRVHDTPYKTWSLVSRFRPCFVGAGQHIPDAGFAIGRHERNAVEIRVCKCLSLSHLFLLAPRAEAAGKKRLTFWRDFVLRLFLGWWELASVPKMSVVSANTSETSAHCTNVFAL